ncbi:MAG: ferredoxin/flavodoxin---NADP+ reductase [Mycobacterium sp.]|nr:ferredoxin/flavodoxin---NADP+ reductase [Mycobacterium sp.]
MAYVITQNCCKDESCVPVCPVDCIRPVGGAGEFTDTKMLYIDPVTCIDCGACLDECPVDAIHYEDYLPEDQQRFLDINADYFERHPIEADLPPAATRHGGVPHGSLRVAVVGAGPAACYAVSELISVDGVEVDLYERLPTPFGLIRAGVAPDHQHTKSVVEIFDNAFSNRRFGCHLNVEIGKHLTHNDLMAHHHAVIYAVGAAGGRDLGIPGEELAGNHAAADFVGWYNGHPDQAGRAFDLSGQRAVIIGNGNVALDIARVLLMSPDELATTDIAQHALDALADSDINEVVILGRRGPRHGAFSVGEFLALGHLNGIDVVIDHHELEAKSDDGVETVLKLDLAREYAQTEPSPGNKRIVFRFLTSPAEFVGGDHVEGLRIARNTLDETGGLVPGDPSGELELIDTTLVLRSIGYQGAAIDGLSFDPAKGVIPNDRGRVLDDQNEPIAGVYATGWIKRGPKGVIGTNRTCAQETIEQLFTDFDNGLLTRDIGDRETIDEILTERGATPIDWNGWRKINAAEIEQGAAVARPRLKFVDPAEMIAASR